MSSLKSPKQVSLSDHANEAITAVHALVKTLPLEDVSSAEIDASRVGNRVPLAVMTIAATILQQNPERFTDFDVAPVREAIAYEQAMAPLAALMKRVGDRIARNIHKRRGRAATETLALYQTLKGMQRLPKNDPLESDLREMETLLTTYRKQRATSLSQKEKTEGLKEKRALKIAAAKRAKLAALQAEVDAADRNAGLDPAPLPAPAPAPVGTPPVPTR